MRRGVVVVFLGLIIGLCLYTPANLAPYSDAPAIVHESPFENFTAAVDGSESDQSLTSFEETISEDVLFYPDVFDNGTIELADYGEDENEQYDPNYVKTQVLDNDAFEEVGIDIEIWFDIDTTEGFEGFSYAHYLYASGQDSCVLGVWNFDTTSFDTVDSPLPTSYDWMNGSVYDPNYWNTTHIAFQLEENGIGTANFYWDYAEVTLWKMTLADAYAESFADVSDWTTSDVSITTDNDVATITENGAGSTGRAYASFSSTDFFEFYYEFRIVSMTASTSNLEFWDGAAYNTLKTFTAAGTYKGLISDADAATMQRIGFLVGSEGGTVLPDYLRISRSNESGWAHDGSTTAGTDAGSSDGDLINVTDSITFDTDTTVTAALIETSYYQFLDVFVDDGAGNILVEGSADGSSWSSIVASTAITADTHYRGNVLTASIDIKQLRVNVTSWATLDFIKLASISNFTVTQGSTDTDEFLYVDSGVLTIGTTGETDYSYYFLLDHDPALSVATATYNIWNLTVSSDNDYCNIKFNIGGWQSWESFGETRGSLASGTLTDLQIQIAESTDGATISAIKFIEDSTAPTVVRSSSTPNDPQDDETVTISAVIEDTVEVYEVDFNAIVYPAGFSDVDYSATEQTDNLWTYSFTTIDAGYYCFKVIASDGANTNSLTEYAYIELTVREAAIIIQEITLIGAGQDFTMMTFSARINRDCSYTIYEESASSPEADTYTGSVSAPSFNLAWEKLDVVDTNVNFTITFVSGSLTENYTSQYQVAQTTFYVERGNDNGEQFSENVTVSGRITKLATYTVYIDNVEGSNGTISSLDFTIEFDKKDTNAAREVWHDFAIKFVNGSQTCWYNSTFYLWKHDPDQPPGGGVLIFDPDFWLKIMIAMSVVFGAGLIILKSTGYGNLPDYKGGT